MKNIAVKINKSLLCCSRIGLAAILIFLLASFFVSEVSYAAGPLFGELIDKGAEIFTGMRDIIYVVAGFGIIAVAVGGFFGNLNWKWLGTIVISLVVIATAGELIVLLTGCEQFGTSLITNTLEAPAPTAEPAEK